MYIFKEYGLFVEFVVLLTKTWPKNIDFYRYSYNVGERAVFGSPPPFHTKK